PLSMPATAIDGVVRDVVRRSAESMPAEDDLAISVFATAGSHAGPSLCIHATPIPARLYAVGYELGIRLVTPATHSVPADTLSPQIKTRSRLHWHVAEAQAERFDPGARALLLDRDGFVTETATGNLFIASHDGQRIVTPLRSRTLHGISQSYVTRLMPQVEEADLHLEDVLAADEVFVTSSVYCLLPVVTINRTPIGDGRPGTVYRKLLDAWSNAVGVDIAGQMSRMAQGEREA
ncbi:MAG: aminotransferase class IV, partial [Planctomycetaceae bacterium]